VFTQTSISTAAHNLIIGLLEHGLLEHERLDAADAMCCTDAREHRAMLEQRLDAVGDMLSSVRPLVDQAGTE